MSTYLIVAVGESAEKALPVLSIGSPQIVSEVVGLVLKAVGEPVPETAAEARPTANGSGISDKYGSIYVEKGNLRPGEPIFLLRAQDLLATDAVRAYADLARISGRLEVERLAKAFAQRMEMWQDQNQDFIKLPD